MNEMEPGRKPAGYLHEVFSGVQGEGLLVGERHLFIRLSGCNLSCAFCDTPSARAAGAACRIEQTAGSRDFAAAQNPITCSDVVGYVERLESSGSPHDALAFTGGEPLTQVEFLASVAREFKTRGLRVLLETNGSLPDALPDVLPVVDVVSMDMKLPSSTGGPELLAQHELFLRRASSVEVYVKIVVTSRTVADEIFEAAKMIEGVDPTTPLVLQPATAISDVLPPSPGDILDWQAGCKRYIRTVRVIPQCHRIMGQL